MPFLYLIAIAWIYVVMLMALTENSIVAGVLTFLFYCGAAFYRFLFGIITEQKASTLEPNQA